MIPDAAAVIVAVVPTPLASKIPKSLTQGLIRQIISSHLYPQVLDQAAKRLLSVQYKFDAVQSQLFNAAFDAMGPPFAALKEFLLKNVKTNIVYPIKQYFTTHSRTDEEVGNHKREQQLKKSVSDAAKLQAAVIVAAGVVEAVEASVQATNNIARTKSQTAAIRSYIAKLLTDSDLFPTPTNQQEIDEGVVVLEGSILLFNANVKSPTNETAAEQVQLKAGITELCKILAHVS